jgi:hypothetical protein
VLSPSLACTSACLLWRLAPAGKSFFKKKKQPIPVDLTHKDWAAQVKRATEATYMFHTGGSCLNIRCTTPYFSASQALSPMCFECALSTSLRSPAEATYIFHASGFCLNIRCSTPFLQQHSACEHRGPSQGLRSVIGGLGQLPPETPMLTCICIHAHPRRFQGPDTVGTKAPPEYLVFTYPAELLAAR